MVGIVSALQDKMMFRRILVPLDGSRHAERVLPLVEEEAARLGSTVTLLHVVPVSRNVLPGSQPTVQSPLLMGNPPQSATDLMKEYLKRMSERLKAKGIIVDYAVQQGTEVGESIARYAREKKIDVIAIATHGRGWMRRILSGSVTDYVMRHSGAAMLVVGPRQRIRRSRRVLPFSEGL